MDNQGQGDLQLPPNHPLHLHADVVQAEAGRRGHQQQYHLLDAARALMLLGAAAAVSTMCSCNAGDDGAGVAQVFLAFLAWLLGVCLLSLVPLVAAGRFREADRLAGAAMTSVDAVFRRFFFIPWN